MKKNVLKKLFIPLLCSVSLLAIGCSKESAPQEVKVESISFATEVSSVYVGHETYITKLKVLPENATNKDISWSVGDSSIVAIREDGHVEGLKAGTTKLIATAKDGSNVKKELEFTVNALEKPSSWKLETSYCFYVEDSFVPDITMYPESSYIDKAVSFEVVEGDDVLEVVDSRISAKKEGSGVIKVTSKANPSLVGNITCVADKDKISKYGFKDVNGGTASILTSKFDRMSVLDFKGQVKKGCWPNLVVPLERTYNTKEFVVYLDARQVSGNEWYSIRLAKDGSIYSQTEYGAEGNGGAPKLDSWTTNTFDFTMFDLDFNQIVLCINADSDYQKGKTDPYTEVLFDNLQFAEFVDNPTSLKIKDNEVILPLGKQSDIEVEFTPKYVRNRELIYKVKTGSENIISVENGKVKGLSKGQGYVEVSSAVDPNIKGEALVVVSDDLLVSMPVVFNDGINVSHKVNYEGYDVVTSYSKTSTGGEAWPGVCYQLPEPVAANSIRISLDCKLVSGYNWFSITYVSSGSTVDELGRNPIKGDWIPFTFESTKNNIVETIVIRINTVISEQSQMTELLFANFGIVTK